MDVTRSVNVLCRIAVALRVMSWVVLALFFAGAVGVAKQVAFIATATEAVESFLPYTAGSGGVLMLVTGVITWLVLLATAEIIMLVVAIEANTRQAAQAVAVAKAEVEEVAAGR